jgi:hypothetical protein
MHPLRFGVAAGCVAAVLAMSLAAHAETIIVFDTFTGAGNGAQLTGRTPSDGNLPGGTWQTKGGAALPPSMLSTTTAVFGDPIPGVFGNGNNSSAIPLSGGSYTPPALMRIRADIKMAPPGFDATSGSAAAGRGMALGFYNTSTVVGQFSQNNFTGLVLDANGNLNLVQDPNNTGFFGAGSFLGTPVAYGGTWNPAAFVTLSYTVDTSTGGLSDITLGGSSADYSSFYNTSLFSATATASAGMYQSADASPRYSALDNFQVTAVPEPGSLLLAAAGLVGAAGRLRRSAGRREPRA